MKPVLPRWHGHRNAIAQPALVLLALLLPANLPAYEAPWLFTANISLSHDDNVANAGVSRDERSDLLTEFSGAINRLFQPNLYWSLEAEAGLTLRRYQDYSRLSYLAPEILGRANFRPGGGFYTPTFSAQLTVAHRNYSSRLRDGRLMRAGLLMQQPLSTRVDLRAGIEQVRRRADNRVFSYSFINTSFELEWRATTRGTLILGYLDRDGGLISTSRDYGSLNNAAERVIADDAFPRANTEQFAYRLDASAELITLAWYQGLSETLTASALVQQRDASAGYGTGYKGTLVSAGLSLKF